MMRLLTHGLIFEKLSMNHIKFPKLISNQKKKNDEHLEPFFQVTNHKIYKCKKLVKELFL
jgi:hypothetical protein